MTCKPNADVDYDCFISFLQPALPNNDWLMRHLIRFNVDLIY